jgi:uncharacterized protein
VHFQNQIITEALIDYAVEGIPGREHGIHGLSHWSRVERNGLYLSIKSGADISVVSLFALFHDARRINDGADPGHGGRGGKLAAELYEKGVLRIDDVQMEVLTFACEFHTDQIHTEDITAGTCWDADRLDLPRIGVSPDPAMLNTAEAQRIAGSGNRMALDSFVFSSHGPQ